MSLTITQIEKLKQGDMFEFHVPVYLNIWRELYLETNMVTSEHSIRKSHPQEKFIFLNLHFHNFYNGVLELYGVDSNEKYAITRFYGLNTVLHFDNSK